MRDRSLDVLKGFLIIGMVYAHVFLQLGQENHWIRSFITVVSAIIFSGFYFSFGYVYQLAYFRKKNKRSVQRILVGAIRTLAVFYICGISFFIFRKNVTFPVLWEKIFQVLTFQAVPDYTEFLTAFFGAAIFALIIFPIWDHLENWVLFLFGGISLAATLVTPFAQIHHPILALFFGTTDYLAFPVLPYLVLFFFGVYLAKKQPLPKLALIPLAIPPAIFLFDLLSPSLGTPSRFPPSFLFITTGILPVYIALKVSQWLAKQNQPIVGVLDWLGKHSLAYLMIHTVALFILRGIVGNTLSPIATVLATIVMMALIAVLLFAYDGLKALVFRPKQATAAA
jgi:peptidoglycan/LPS O-acetylase OafA/YrhL